MWMYKCNVIYLFFLMRQSISNTRLAAVSEVLPEVS